MINSSTHFWSQTLTGHCKVVGSGKRSLDEGQRSLRVYPKAIVLNFPPLSEYMFHARFIHGITYNTRISHALIQNPPMKPQALT